MLLYSNLRRLKAPYESQTIGFNADFRGLALWLYGKGAEFGAPRPLTSRGDAGHESLPRRGAAHTEGATFYRLFNSEVGMHEQTDLVQLCIVQNNVSSFL